MVQQPFKTMLFGFAFSPTLEINIMETSRLAHFFNSKLVLLHVGEKTADKAHRINGILDKIEHKDLDFEIHWETGDPVETILKASQSNDVDLLVLGAMQRENVFTFYVGSIARKLTRQVKCSVLLLIKPAQVRVPCQHIVVNGLDDPDTPTAIRCALYTANALGAKRVTIVEEIRQQEVQVTVEDDKSLRQATLRKERLKAREESRVQHILEAMPEELTSKVSIKSQSIFGKRGYSIGHYAEVIRADLLVMNAPRKSGVLDRIFPHDIEYILSDLPTDVLIIRNSS
ncbi:MAG: universal stress protein [Flavobacteriaceae bacterium]|nr:universal stress protein [Flavobacteriaceae bacterium]